LDPLIRVGVLVTAFLLVGCAPRWHRPGASEETFLIDRLECREEARVWQRRGDSFRETWRVDSNTFALCMTRRGYTRGVGSSGPPAEGPPVASPPPSRD
jgi:hypothetical protein